MTGNDNRDSSDRQQQLDEVLAELMRAIDTGEVIESQRWMARYPEFAAQLHEFFVHQERAEKLVRPLRQAAANALHVRCPHCHNPIELLDDAALAEISCPSCGSSFSLVGDGTVSHYQPGERTVGHFQLLDRVGVGQFGSVWKARDTKLDRTVAIKIPRNSQLEGSQAELFLRDARAAAQLKHPNIVSVHEVGKQDETVFIVSDFVHGVTLKEWLAAKQITPREAAELCIKIARALHHAHEAGVVHRDLKPGNIMMDVDGEPHIVDFGLAKREAGEMTMTMEGQILGTPAYMSPEQARGEGHQVDRRADIYSLGVILFELLTGELPFRGDKQMLIVQILKDDPPSPRKLNIDVPRDLETICLKCLNKEPHRRYPSSAAMALDVDRYLKGMPIQARQVNRLGIAIRWCRRKPAAAGLVGLALLVAMLIVALAVGRHYNERLRASNVDLSIAKVAAERANILAIDRERMARRERAAALAAQNQAEDAREEARRQMYAAHMSLAQQAIRDEDLTRAYDLLEQFYDDDSKWFEWQYLWQQCGGEISRLPSHAGTIRTLASSRDGRRLATWTVEDNRLALWDVGQRKRIAALEGTKQRSHVALSSSGSAHYLATGDGQLLVWTIGETPETRVVAENLAEITAIALSIDESILATGHADGKIMLWDTDSLSLTRDWQADSGAINDLDFAPDSRQLISASDDNPLRAWDMSGIDLELMVKNNERGHSHVKYSPNGALIAALTNGRRAALAYVWNRESGEARVFECMGNANSLVFAPDSKKLAVAGDIRRTHASPGRPFLQIIDLDGSESDRQYSFGYANHIRAAMFAPGADHLVVAVDEKIRIWPLRPADNGFTVEGADAGHSSLAINGVGNRLATIHRSKSSAFVRISDARTGEEQRRITIGSRIYDVTFSADDNYIAVASNDAVQYWDLKTGELRRTLSASGKKPIFHTRVCFDPSSEHLACAHSNGTIVWDVESGDVVLDIVNDLSRPANWSSDVAFCSDGKRLARTARFGGIEVWDVETKTKILTIPTEYTVVSIAFSPDDRWIVGAGFDAAIVEVWEAVDGHHLAELRGHQTVALDAKFNSDGTRLVTASRDGTVRIWDTTIWQQVLQLGELNANSFATVALSGDGKLIAANGKQGARVWSVTHDN